MLYALSLGDLAKLTPIYIPLLGWSEFELQTSQLKKYQATLTTELKRRGHI